MKAITGEKVTLRPATIHDRRTIFEWLTQSDITQHMIGPPHFSDNEIPTWESFIEDYNAGFFNNTDPDSGRSYIIELAGKGIGHISYNKLSHDNSTVELDIWMSGSPFCNMGYGTDAITTLCTHLAAAHNFRPFILAPSARNRAAVRAYNKCGFEITDTVPAGFIPDYFDTVIMIRKS